MKKIVKINEAQLHDLIRNVVNEETQVPHNYKEHWENKFIKSAEILLQIGYHPEDLIQKIKIIINKNQI